MPNSNSDRSATSTPTASASKTAIIAHRGVPGLARENTLASFEEAWKQEADGMETDVHLTKDGQVVCHHNSYIPGAFFGCLEISRASYKRAKRAFGKGRRPGEHLPLLSEVLEALPPGKIIYIEVKCGPEIVPALKEVLQESPVSPEQVAVICFDPAVILEWKQAMPEVKAFWLSKYLRETHLPYQANTPSGLLKKATAAGADGISIQEQESLDMTLVQYLHNQGLEVHVWTVDRPQQAVWYRDMGLDSITTNHPGTILEYLKRKTGIF